MHYKTRPSFSAANQVVTLTRVTNDASCNWVNLLQVSSVQGQVKYCSLTSLNITQMISDKQCGVYYEINFAIIFI